MSGGLVPARRWGGGGDLVTDALWKSKAEVRSPQTRPPPRGYVWAPARPKRASMNRMRDVWSNVLRAGPSPPRAPRSEDDAAWARAYAEPERAGDAVCLTVRPCRHALRTARCRGARSTARPEPPTLEYRRRDAWSKKPSFSSKVMRSAVFDGIRPGGRWSRSIEDPGGVPGAVAGGPGRMLGVGLRGDDARYPGRPRLAHRAARSPAVQLRARPVRLFQRALRRPGSGDGNRHRRPQGGQRQPRPPLRRQPDPRHREVPARTSPRTDIVARLSGGPAGGADARDRRRGAMQLGEALRAQVAESARPSPEADR